MAPLNPPTLMPPALPSPQPRPNSSFTPRWLLAILLLATATLHAAEALPGFPLGKFMVDEKPGQIAFRNAAGHLIATYQGLKPANLGTNLVVDSGGFFHPLATPSGLVLTDVAPPDHPHHRGVFLGFVEVHGKADADFWGWGAHAPVQGRRILNRSLGPAQAYGAAATFNAANDWMADSTTVLREKLAATLRSTTNANVLELTYTLTPEADVTLAQWAFGGFCVRLPRNGTLQARALSGPINLPAPSHLKPETDWPDERWYDFTLTFPDGRLGGITVLNHPANPPTLWHNNTDVRILNPCITAPASVTLKAAQPLTLRYRLVVHDGPPPLDLLERLTREWSK